MSCAELIVNKLKEKHTKNNLDVAFICYNASMWDSLESVYLLVKDKWNVEVICPYYIKGQEITTDVDLMPKLDHNPTTTLTKEHYDIIFNNNPYDDGNLVTRIIPTYWNVKLAKICDTLVFIPYFCNPHGIEENIVLTNGFFCSNMVIVDTEEVKTYCCKVMNKFCKEQMGKDLDFSEKIFAFGSPKYDKVLNDKKENYIIPSNWKDIIGDRKIILLNTSLKPFLQNPNKIEDLKYILNRYKNDPNYVIWWRPHPLMRATIENLCPNKLEDYDFIVKWALESNCIIYDDTSDLHRAITLSDLSIMDISSVMYLYEKTGKRMVLMDDYIKNKNL